MKRASIVKSILAVVALLSAAGAWADTETVDGIEWSYTVSDGKAFLDRYCIDSSTTGAIAIPTTLCGYPVASIGSEAFYNCSGLTRVTIPNCVTNIGNAAFGYCSELTSVTIPEGVTSIGWGAFRGCVGLASAMIPDSVTIIMDGAFEGCRGLTNVVLSENLVNLGYTPYNSDGCGVFSGCTGLRQIEIPDSVTSIGWYAFSGCSGLTSVTIPDGVTSIGSRAFAGCSGLRDVIVPQSACIGRMSSLFPSAYQSITNVIISDCVTNIGPYAFGGCCGLTSLVIPDSVMSIGRGAFKGCSGLANVTIPNGVTVIADDVFSSCSGLTTDISEMFAALGLPQPKPVPLMKLHHQVAQKLHRLTDPSQNRPHDLIDLQLVFSQNEIDLALVRSTCERLFAHRRRQAWPAKVVMGELWDAGYAAAKYDLPVKATVAEAVDWANDLIALIDEAH